MPKRPFFSASLTAQDFASWYWLKEELVAFCREHLAGLKCPRSVDFEAELPRLPTGKLYKQGLRDEYRKAMA